MRFSPHPPAAITTSPLNMHRVDEGSQRTHFVSPQGQFVGTFSDERLWEGLAEMPFLHMDRLSASALATYIHSTVVVYLTAHTTDQVQACDDAFRIDQVVTQCQRCCMRFENLHFVRVGAELSHRYHVGRSPIVLAAACCAPPTTTVSSFCCCRHHAPTKPTRCRPQAEGNDNEGKRTTR